MIRLKIRILVFSTLFLILLSNSAKVNAVTIHDGTYTTDKVTFEYKLTNFRDSTDKKLNTWYGLTAEGDILKIELEGNIKGQVYSQIYDSSNTLYRHDVSIFVNDVEQPNTETYETPYYSWRTIFWNWLLVPIGNGDGNLIDDLASANPEDWIINDNTAIWQATSVITVNLDYNGGYATKFDYDRTDSDMTFDLMTSDEKGGILDNLPVPISIWYPLLAMVTMPLLAKKRIFEK